jgi:hypothetical protein
MLGPSLFGQERCRTRLFSLDRSFVDLFGFQTASADWFADILRHTYDDALCMKGIEGGVDGVFICAGMLRGDSVYGPGVYNSHR